MYAKQLIEENICEEWITPSSHLNKWTSTEKYEIYRFLEIILWIGLDKELQLSDYWRNSVLVKSSQSNVTHQVWNFIKHSGGRLHKIQSLLDALNPQFKKFVIPEENMCVNETLPWKIKISSIHKKRHKLGIKLFKLCLREDIHFTPKFDGMFLTTKMVLELLDGSLAKGVTLYIEIGILA